LKHVGANSVTSVTAYVILYSYIEVHKLVQIKSRRKLSLLYKYTVEAKQRHFITLYF